MFQLYTRYTLTMPQGTISDAGIRAIEQFLSSQNLQSDVWKNANPTSTIQLLPALPNDWQWVWVIEHGEYSGTMPKRIAKYFYKVHGISVPESVNMTLGNIAREHSSAQETFNFEFVNRIDWKAGEFGDRGSCWWTFASGSRLMWENNNGMAIRFYSESSKGIGRAWIMEVDSEIYTVMNGYGLTTLEVTRIFAQFTGLTYKQIYLDNSISTMQINGNSGYIVGKLADIEPIEEWDFSLEGEDIDVCNRCGRAVYEDEQYIGADDLTYCGDCFYDLFDSCEHCGGGSL